MRYLTLDQSYKKQFYANVEHSDSYAVSSVSDLVEYVVSFELAKALLKQFFGNQFTFIQHAVADC